MDEQFDERYPAVFQPGGDDLHQTGEPALRLGLVAAPGEPDPQPHAEPLGVHPALPMPVVPQGASQAPRRGWVWFAPLAVAATMLAAGVFALTAQYWFEISMVPRPANRLGVEPEPWGQRLYRAAPALLAIGLGVLAAVLFLASRLRAQTEAACRAAFGVLALIVGVAGWIAVFAFVLFPEQSNFSGPAYDGSPRRTPWPYVVMACGPELLVLALIMLVVLVAVPRLWLQDPADSQNPSSWQAVGKPSVRRGICCGVVATAAGVLALLAPLVFEHGGNLRAGEGDSVEMGFPSWPELAQYVSPPLLLVGLGTLAWAAIHGTVQHACHSVGAGPGKSPPTGVEP